MRLRVFMSAGGVAIRASQLSSVRLFGNVQREKELNPRRADAATPPQNIQLFTSRPVLYTVCIYNYTHRTPCSTHPAFSHTMTRIGSSHSSQAQTAGTVSVYATSFSQTSPSPPPSPSQPPHPSPQLFPRQCVTPYAATRSSPPRPLCLRRL